MAVWLHQLPIRPVILDYQEDETGSITPQEVAKRVHALLTQQPLTKNETFTDTMLSLSQNPEVEEDEVDDLLQEIYDFCGIHRIWCGDL